MNVCIINAPWETEERWGIRSGCRFPNLMLKKHNSYVPFPFLLAYTASYLESKGIEVLLLDGVAERSSRESFIERITGFHPDLVIAETATTSLQYDVELLEQVKARLPATHIAIFGSHVSVLPEDGLKSSAIDFVMQGEPEYTSFELVQSLSNGKDYAAIQGLAYRDHSQTVTANLRRPLIPNIDELPYPKRLGLPLDRYNVAGFPPQVVFLYGSRGCPYRCDFCLWPQTIFEEGNYRPRSAKNIVDEIEWILANIPQTKSLFFDDDCFNIGRQRLNDFAFELQRRGIKIPWGCNARADNWDRSTLENLAKSGLFTLRIGIESGDQRVLDRIKKSYNIQHAKEMLQMSHEEGILNHVMFVVGLQGETWESVEQTANFIRSAPVDSVQFSVAIPFPGTRYYDYVLENDFFVTRDWEKFNGFDHVVMRTEEMSAKEVMEALNYLRRRVYFSPRFIRKRLKYIRSGRDLAAIIRKVARLIMPKSPPGS